MRYLLFLISSLICFNTFSMDSLKVSRMPKYRYYIYGGTFFPVSETTLRINGNFAGTSINVENDFKLKGKGVSFRAEALGQFSPRSAVSLTYFSVFRHGETILDRDFTYGDSTLNVGAKLNSYFNIRFMGATYRYSIFYNKTWNVGVTTGLRVLNVDVGATLDRNNGESYSNSFSVFIPVVLVGIHGSAYITPKLLARYSFEYFGVTIQGINGRVFDNRLTLEYYILKNFSLGCSFTNIKYSVVDFPVNSRFNGDVSYSVSGFSLYLGARF